MRTIGLLVLAVTLAAALLPQTVSAANPTPTPIKSGPTGSCLPIFGGGQTCVSSGNLIVNKLVKSPNSDNYVDTLGSDNAFAPNQDITFRIIVTNNNNSTLSNVTVKDNFPAFLTFVSGSGNYDTTKHTLTYTIDKLEGNETKSLTVQARIVGSDALPSQPLTCLPNQVEVRAGARRSTDNVQFCVQTGNTAQVTPTQPQTPATNFSQLAATPTPVKSGQTQPTPTPNTTKGGTPLYPTPVTGQTPDTGPELLGLLSLLPLAGSGLILRKKAGLR